MRKSFSHYQLSFVVSHYNEKIFFLVRTARSATFAGFQATLCYQLLALSNDHGSNGLRNWVSEAHAVNFHTSRVARSTMPVNVWVVWLLLVRKIHHARPIEINGAKRALACCFHDHNNPLPIGRFLWCEVPERRSVALEDREEEEPHTKSQSATASALLHHIYLE
jgi:hypothetical protein